MSDSIARISLAVALEGDRTDWSRVGRLDDEAITAAMAEDADAFGMPVAEKGVPAFYQIYRDARAWRWRLTAGGRTVAEGADAYATADAASAAVGEYRHAFATAEVRAA